MDADAFRRAFGLLPEPSLLLSLTGRILACNAQVYSLLGLPRTAALEGEELQALLHDAPERVDRFLRLCRRSRQLVPGSLTCRTASGGELACRAEGALLTPATEQAPGAVLLRVFAKQELQNKFVVLNERISALHREILERQRAQTRLHAEREWLRTTLASIGDAVIATGADCNVSFMNAVAEELTGWPQSEAEGQPLDTVFRIVNEYSRQPVENPVRAVLTRGTIVGLANHTLLIGRDGTERPIADSGAPIRDEQGKIIGVVLVFRDVTESHRTQELIVRSEKRFRRIFETAHVAILEQDFSQTGGVLSQARTVDVNQAAVELFEAAGKEELLQRIQSVFTPDAYEALEEALQAASEGRSSFQSEAPLVSLRGRHIQAVFTVSFPSGDPTRSSVLVSFMDITGRNRAEEALRRANTALVRANGDLEHFAYAAAHDLQEPLRNVVLHTQLLQRRYADLMDERGREACQVSVDGARRMQALVNGLLEYTRVVSESQVESDMESESSLNCGQILASVKANLRTAIEESHASIECDDLPVVNARETHLLQLFQNLLSNAIKYRKPDQPAVIHITARQENGNWVFLVEDNGVGIRSEYQRKIFEAFRRLHGREIPGAGMGLTICSRIVAHYGGKMWVESEEGRGSTFAFTLPQHKRG